MRKTSPIVIGLLLGAILGTLCSLASSTGLMRGFEHPVYDRLSRWFQRPDEAAASRVKVLLMTDADVHAYRKEGDAVLGFFPPPRSFWGELISVIREKTRGGAILLDLVLPDPSRLPSDDEELATFLSGMPEVVLAMSLHGQATGDSDLEDPQPLPPSATVIVYGNDEVLTRKPIALLPAPALLEAAPRLGNAFIEPDGDGVTRRIPVAAIYAGQHVPSFPVAACMTQFGESSIGLAPDGRAITGFGGTNVPLDGDGNLLLDFKGKRGSFPTESISNLYAALTKPDENHSAWFESLKEGDVVVIGANVTGAKDMHAVPTDDAMPGPEVLATAIDNIIRGDASRRPPGWILFALPILLGAAVGGLSVLGYRRRMALWFAVPLVIAYLGAVAFTFSRGLVLDVVTPLSASFLSYASVAVFLYNTEGRRRREIRSAFSQYMSEEVVSDLEQHPDAVRLGGEMRVMTVLFSDIANFTGVSERMSPEQLVAFLNDYLTRMTDTILDHAGVIDKYEGDAIMAFWGAPIKREDHARLALSAAARFRERLMEFSAEKEAAGLARLDTRIGLNTGPMVVGNMGSSRRFDYTVIGDAVNLGARLEGANKFFGSTTMLTQQTLDAAGDGAAITRSLGRIRVKGRDKPVHVHELLGAGGAGFVEVPDWARRFEQGLALFQKKSFDQAIQAFRNADQLRDGGDPPSLRFVEFCAEARSNAKFDGVITLTEK